MATGKHFRPEDTPRQTVRRTPAAPQHTVRPAVEKKTDYEDMYSYEEPRGAKRGTRRPTTTAPHGAPARKPAKKPSKVPTVIAILCLLAAAGIMFYVLWDLGVVNMLLSMLK